MLPATDRCRTGFPVRPGATESAVVSLAGWLPDSPLRDPVARKQAINFRPPSSQSPKRPMTTDLQRVTRLTLNPPFDQVAIASFMGDIDQPN